MKDGKPGEYRVLQLIYDNTYIHTSWNGETGNMDYENGEISELSEKGWRFVAALGEVGTDHDGDTLYPLTLWQKRYFNPDEYEIAEAEQGSKP